MSRSSAGTNVMSIKVAATSAVMSEEGVGFKVFLAPCKTALNQ